MPSDYVKDLVDHKVRVAAYMQSIANDLFRRAMIHDNSKFSEEEYHLYEAACPELQKHAYGSPEYKEAVKQLGPAWEHHCKVNDHHPEFHREDGVSAMTLVQLIEMLCDWLAASERSQTNFEAGLKMNKERFHIDDQLFEIIVNTVKWYAPVKFLGTDPLF
jgi:hypothetical protein